MYDLDNNFNIYDVTTDFKECQKKLADTISFHNKIHTGSMFNSHREENHFLTFDSHGLQHFEKQIFFFEHHESKKFATGYFVGKEKTYTSIKVNQFTRYRIHYLCMLWIWFRFNPGYFSQDPIS